jgi:hypothetical protein
MYQLKSIAPDAVPAALEKALRYRLLNEPWEAESICRDVLLVDPHNQEALVTLLLALTDLFDDEYVTALQRAKAVLPQIESAYERAYYEGIVYERWAKAESGRHVPGHVLQGWYLQAMRSFERAEALAEPDNPDAILRWNACARQLAHDSDAAIAEPSFTHDIDAEFADEVPQR